MATLIFKDKHFFTFIISEIRTHVRISGVTMYELPVFEKLLEYQIRVCHITDEVLEVMKYGILVVCNISLVYNLLIFLLIFCGC